MATGLSGGLEEFEDDEQPFSVQPIQLWSRDAPRMDHAARTPARTIQEQEKRDSMLRSVLTRSGRREALSARRAQPQEPEGTPRAPDLQELGQEERDLYESRSPSQALLIAQLTERLSAVTAFQNRILDPRNRHPTLLLSLKKKSKKRRKRWW